MSDKPTMTELEETNLNNNIGIYQVQVQGLTAQLRSAESRLEMAKAELAKCRGALAAIGGDERRNREHYTRAIYGMAPATH
jgi:hypothetical protein